MKIDDKGFMINKQKYNENSVIAEFFTENNGKVSGIIFGATSTKIKNFLLVGNQFNIQYNSTPKIQRPVKIIRKRKKYLRFAFILERTKRITRGLEN